MNLVIKEITTSKKQFIDLLLIGDEQPGMIDRYLDKGRLFIGFIGDNAVSCVVSVEESATLVEVKNLAVLPEFRKNGIGKAMLQYVESLYRGYSIQLGTGETPSTLRFYQNCGYRYSHKIHNFFTDNYDHPIIEEGVLLNDMIYLQKQL